MGKERTHVHKRAVIISSLLPTSKEVSWLVAVKAEYGSQRAGAPTFRIFIVQGWNTAGPHQLSNASVKKPQPWFLL
jgi:hypothetical protein